MKGKKSLLGRIVSLALSFVVGITTLAGVGVDLKASASSLSLEQIWSQNGYLQYFYFWGLGNNGSAFCVQNHTALNNYEDYYTSPSYYTDAINTAIGYAQYYGYPNFSGTTRSTYTENYYCATQAIIWEIVEGRRSTSTYKASSSYRYTLNSTAQSYYDTISQKMINHKALLPSYNNKTVKLKYNSTTGKYEGTIKDTNGVASNMVSVINNTSGYTATASGNNIKVTATSKASKTFTASKTFPTKGNYPNLTYYIMYSDDQTLAYGLPRVDPVPVKVTLYGEQTVGNMNIKKVYYDDNGDVLKATSTYTSASKFRIAVLDDDDKITGYVVATGNATSGYTFSKIVTASSDATSFAVPAAASSNSTSFTVKNVPTGTYKITETSAPTGFRGSSAEVEVKNGKTVTASLKNTQNLDHYYIKAHKYFAPLEGGTYDAFDYAEYLYNLGGFEKLSDAEDYVERLFNSVYFNAYFLKNGVKYYITESSLLPYIPSDGVRIMSTTDTSPTYKNLSTNKSDAFDFKLGTSNTTMWGSLWIDFLRDTEHNGGYSEEIYFEEELENNLSTTNRTFDIAHWSSRKSGTSTATVARHGDYTATNDLNVYNYERYVTASFRKRDRDNGDFLNGAEYSLFEKKGTTANPSTDTILETKETDDTGDWISFSTRLGIKDTYNGKYYVKETKAPDGYQLDNTIYPVYLYVTGTTDKVTNPEQFKYQLATVPITVAQASYNNKTLSDKPVPAEINIYKKDDIGNENVSGISFDIIAAEDIKESTGNDYSNTVKYAKGTTVMTITTDANGKATTGKVLPWGTYTVKESSTKSPYIVRDSAQTVTLDENKLSATKDYVSEDVTFTNEVQHVNLTVYKVDSKHNTVGLEGAEFTITAAEDFYIGGTKIHNKGDVIGKLTTDKDGVAKNVIKSDDTVASITELATLYVGASYTITETKAPKNYVLVSTAQSIVAGHNVTLNAEYAEIEKTFPNTHKTGTISVIKLDNDKRTIKLAGAEFKLTAAEDITEADGTVIYAKGATIEENVKTGADGKATFTTELPVGFKYTVTETKAPKGYKISGAAQTFSLDDNATVEHVSVEKTFYDTEKKGTLTIYKRDNDTKVGLAGAEFKVTAAEDILYSDGSVRTAKGTVVVDKLVTDANGKASYANLPFGKYTVTETKAPTNFKILTSAKDVELVFADVDTIAESNLVKSVEFYNDWITYPVHAKKIDADGTEYPLAGAKFSLVADEDVKKADGTVIYAKGKIIETVETNVNGDADFKAVPMGWKYKIVEDKAPVGYNGGFSESFTLTKETTLTAPNTPQPVKITIYKQDGDTKVGLSGAQFRVYADENILRSNGTVWAKKGDIVINSITTNTNGYAEATTADTGAIKGEKLRLGKYKIEEIVPPTLFVKDSNIQYAYGEYDPTVEIVEERVTFTDKRQMGEITVFKKDNDTKTYLAGAVFSLKATTDVKKADGTVLYKANAEIERVTTGKDGKASFKEVPVGYTYTVTEEIAPINYVNKHEAKTFDLLYNAEIEFVTTSKEFENDWQNGVISVFKMDGDTKVGLAGAEFTLTVGEKDVKKADGTICEIENSKGEKVKLTAGTVIDTVTTGKDGKASFVNVPVSYQYKVTETKAPVNYVNAHEEKVFDLLYNAELEFVAVTEEYTNKYQTGEISVFKKDGDTKVGLAGAKFTLTVGEKDVLKADGTVWEIENSNGEKVKLTAGAIVDTVITGKDGKISFVKVPVGYQYIVSEIEAPKNFVNKYEQHTFDLLYNAEIEFVSVSEEFENNWQNGEISVTKKDFETDESLAGAEFTLAVGEKDVLKADGSIWEIENSKGVKVKLTAGAVIEENVTTDASGKAVFTTKVPVGYQYKVTETKAPVGYALTHETQVFDLTYNAVIELVSTTQNFKNKPITVEISKRDAEGEELKGATMQLLKEDGKTVIEEWVSDGTNHVVKKIAAGNYVLRETAAPEGYTLATDIKFTVDEENKVFVKGFEVTTKSDDDIPLIVMYDGATKVSFSKRNAEGDELKGATLQLINDKNEVVETWISDGTNHLVTNLPVGTYTLRETASPKGYNIATDIIFAIDANNVVTIDKTIVEAKSDDDIPLVVMVDSATKVEFHKVDDEGNNLAGAKLRIVDNEGNVVKEWISTAEPTVMKAELVSGLEYTVEELEQPKGYCLHGKFSFTVSTNGETDIVTIVNKPTIVEVSKVSLTGEEEIEGATMQILDENGKVIDEWISKTVPHVLRAQLEANKKYFVHEVTPPKGYTYTGDVEFTVSGDGSTDKVKMNDDDTKVAISKRDADGNELAGAKLQILDSEGNLVDLRDKEGNLVTEWISDGTNHVVRNLPVGDYILRETASPKGYYIATDIAFNISVSADNPNKTIVTVGEAVVDAVSDDDIPLIVMIDEATKVSFYKVDDEGNNLEGAKLRIVDNEGNVVKEWISTAEPIVLKGELVAGLEYTLEETEQPKGYWLHGAFAFTVSTHGEIEDVVKLENQPVVVEISKVTLTGQKELAGAKMQIIDEDGNVIDEWVSTDVAHVLRAQLEANKTYYVHELVAPKGYIIGDDVEFTITDSTKPTIVVVNNEHQQGAIHIFKQDKDTKKGLEGAKFEIVAAEDVVINGEVVYKKGDVIATVTTDKDGKATVDKLYTGFTYNVVEVEAPEGYVIENDTTPVKLDIDTEMEYVEVEVSIENTNGNISIRVTPRETENPKTADTMTYGGLALILSLFGFVVFFKKKRA